MSPSPGPTPGRNAQIRRVLIGLLIANVGVVGAKFVIGLGTGSLAVLGDAVHSSVDSMNNVLGLVVIAVASRAPDEDHPYGHEKFETLGALAIVAFLSVAGFEIVQGAFLRLVRGAEPITITPLQFTILIGTLLVNTWVASYETRRGRALNSEILLADAEHTRSDVFVTLGVLAGVGLSRAGLVWADPLVALVVAAVIVVLAYRIVARSIPVLVDQHAVPADSIRAAAEGVIGVERAYDIRSRGTHDHRFAELTIAVDRTATVEAAHRVADAVERRLRDGLDFHQVVVHVEPC